MSEIEPVEAAEPVEVATTEPTEELGEKGVKALTEERAARKKSEKELADALAKVKQYEDEKLTEEQRTTQALEAAKAELVQLTVAKARAEVAATTSVPVDILSGPKGTSPEDIQAFAEALIAFRGVPAKPSASPFIDGTNKVTADVDLDGAIAAAEKARNFPLAITLKQQKAALTKG